MALARPPTQSLGPDSSSTADLPVPLLPTSTLASATPVCDMLLAAWVLDPAANKDCYTGGVSGKKSDSKVGTRIDDMGMVIFAQILRFHFTAEKIPLVFVWIKSTPTCVFCLVLPLALLVSVLHV